LPKVLRQLTTGHFTPLNAVQNADDEIRALVRQCNMPSPWLELDYQTEPSFFKALATSGHEHDLVLIQPENFASIAGLGIRSIRKVYLNGAATDIGYLHHLRFHSKIRGGSYLLRGYKEFRRIFNEKPLPVTLTSIVADNHHARQMLENRRADGAMPTYKEVSRYLTALIPVRGPGRRWPVRIRSSCSSAFKSRRLTPQDAPALASLFAEAGERYECVPCFSVDNLIGKVGDSLPCLIINDFIGIFDDERLVASAAIWDQRTFRQIILSRIDKSLGIARDLWNLGSRLWGTCPVPEIGSPVNFMLIDPWIVKPGIEDQVLPELLALAIEEARIRGADFAAFGTSEKNPAIRSIKTMFFIPYWSIIYQVYWPETGSYYFADRNLYLSNLGAL